MNSEEQREYEERMGSPEMEYLQYQTEHPEMHEGQSGTKNGLKEAVEIATRYEP